MLKKLFVIACLMALSVPGFADLNNEEVSTVLKLGELGIIEKARTVQELEAPLSAKDVFSVTIKALNVASDMDYEHFTMIDSQYSDALINLYDWQNIVDSEIKGLKSAVNSRDVEIRRLKEDQTNLTILGIFSFIFILIKN